MPVIQLQTAADFRKLLVQLLGTDTEENLLTTLIPNEQLKKIKINTKGESYLEDARENPNVVIPNRALWDALNCLPLRRLLLIDDPTTRGSIDLKTVQKIFECPILLGVTLSPTVTPAGHNYDYDAISRHAQDPMTRKPLSINELLPNMALRSLLLLAVQKDHNILAEEIKHAQDQLKQQLKAYAPRVLIDCTLCLAWLITFTLLLSPGVMSSINPRQEDTQEKEYDRMSGYIGLFLGEALILVRLRLGLLDFYSEVRPLLSILSITRETKIGMPEEQAAGAAGLDAEARNAAGVAAGAVIVEVEGGEAAGAGAAAEIVDANAERQPLLPRRM